MNTFVYYQLNNIFNSATVPGAVHLRDNYTSGYFRKYLFEKAISVFKWELPDTWNKDYFLYVLYSYGYIGVFDTAKFGVIPQFGTLDGFDLYYAPANFMISNPLLETRSYRIGTECEIIKLQGTYTGILDLVNYYAVKLALIAEAIDSNLINSKSSVLFFAKNKAAADSMKKVYDQIASGNPAVVLDKELLDENGKPNWLFFQQNLKENYIVSDLLVDARKIENQFCTDLGIPNTNTEKRERMTDDEINANNTETSTRAELWLERLKEGVENVNTMFSDKLPSKISVDWRVKPDESLNVNSFPVPMEPGTI